MGSVVVARGLSSCTCGLWSTGSVVVVHGLSCSTAGGIFPDQGSNLCPLHWQADSYPLRYQGSPAPSLLNGKFPFIIFFMTFDHSVPCFLSYSPFQAWKQLCGKAGFASLSRGQCYKPQAALWPLDMKPYPTMPSGPVALRPGWQTRLHPGPHDPASSVPPPSLMSHWQ